MLLFFHPFQSGPLQTEAVTIGVVDLIVKLLKTCSDDIVLCGKLMMCAGNMADQGMSYYYYYYYYYYVVNLCVVMSVCAIMIPCYLRHVQRILCFVVIDDVCWQYG